MLEKHQIVLNLLSCVHTFKYVFLSHDHSTEGRLWFEYTSPVVYLEFAENCCQFLQAINLFILAKWPSRILQVPSLYQKMGSNIPTKSRSGIFYHSFLSRFIFQSVIIHTTAKSISLFFFYSKGSYFGG